MPDQSVIGPYEKAEKDGSRIKSVTAVLRDGAGRRIGFLCINMDMPKFNGAIELLRVFTSSSNAMPGALFKGDLREQVNLVLRNELLRIKTVPVPNREDRSPDRRGSRTCQHLPRAQRRATRRIDVGNESGNRV